MCRSNHVIVLSRTARSAATARVEGYYEDEATGTISIACCSDSTRRMACCTSSGIRVSTMTPPQSRSCLNP